MLDRPDMQAATVLSSVLLLICIAMNGQGANWPPELRLAGAAAAEEAQPASADDAPLVEEKHPPPVVNYVAPKPKRTDGKDKKESDAKDKAKERAKKSTSRKSKSGRTKP